jgi:hypothetical protein
MRLNPFGSHPVNLVNPVQKTGMRHVDGVKRLVLLRVVALLGAAAMTGCKIPKPPKVPGPVQAVTRLGDVGIQRELILRLRLRLRSG